MMPDVYESFDNTSIVQPRPEVESDVETLAEVTRDFTASGDALIKRYPTSETTTWTGLSEA